MSEAELQVETLIELTRQVKRIADFFQIFIDSWEEADEVEVNTIKGNNEPATRTTT